jgi:hypothetical protein
VDVRSPLAKGSLPPRGGTDSTLRGGSRSIFGLLIACQLVTYSCSKPSNSQSSSVESRDMAHESSKQLWGEMKPVVSVKELMRDLIDPVADNIFDAVAIIDDHRGTHERHPATDEDWDKIRVGATAMAEASYLLKVRRPFAPVGDLNNSIGANAVELSPDQITAKVQKDPVEWNARIEALRNVGLEVLDIVKRKNANELWDAAENLDIACENCHRSYWYPGETRDFYAGLDRRLREMERSQPSGEHPSPKPVPGRNK